MATYNFEPDILSEGTDATFNLVLPYNQSLTRIVLLHNEVELASRQASANPPSLTVTSPNGGEMLNGSTATLQWTASDADNDALHYLIQYSSNAGATWQTLASDWTSTSYDLNLDSIAGTSQGLIKVIASDGFYSNQDQSDAFFSINTHPPQATIRAPLNNSYFVGDQNIVLDGSVIDAEEGQLSNSALVWTSNLNGSLGSGQTLTVNALDLAEGTHTITLTARDGTAQVGTASINVRIYRTAPTIPTTLAIAPTNMSFIARQGGSLTEAQTLSVRNDGEGTLNWTASTNQNWIQLGKPSGTAPSNIQIRTNPAGLANGTYTGRITITTSNASNSPQSIDVSLTIGNFSFGEAPFDFDGDGKTDYGVFRPLNGVWYLQNSTSGFAAAQFGINTDKISPADYDGDGKTDIAVFRNGNWYLLQSSQGFTGVQFGLTDDIPMPADYDGDGKADIAVFRPSNGTWYSLRSSQGFIGVQFGQNGDKPVAADYDGDGKTDIAVYRNGSWYLLQSNLGFAAVGFGIASDRPVPADFDGDGKADIAVYRNGIWYLLRSQLGFAAVSFGIAEDKLVAGDYDGDGKADIAVWRPSTGAFYILQSQAGFAGIGFGQNGDVPVASAFVP